MKQLIKILGLLLIILAIIGLCVFFWGYQQLHKPYKHNKESDLITIESGMGKRAIIDRLVEKDIISNPWPILVYLSLKSEEGKLQAGEYIFSSPITPLEVVAKLRQGLVVTQQITIPEGYDKYDVVQALVAAEIDSQEAIEKAINDTSLIRDLDPKARSLEGYLFPDTYTYTRQQKAPQIIAAMVKRFRQVLTPERQKKLQEKNLTLHELITMASLVEKEAKADEERGLVAAVFYNRLKKEMRLDCDPTFIYAAKLENVWDNQVNNPIHRKRESLYNTYYITGLPAGPIASPGLKSIDAALSPTEVDYLYFVATGRDGRHNFSRTESEHLAAVAAYRRNKKQQQNQ
ncbi:MAG: endolytic transglycosylase MltG [Acidobacteria bacterium]|nr:endolytic transglycosylase MltG [Acidobacteriota bacterium]